MYVYIYYCSDIHAKTKEMVLDSVRADAVVGGALLLAARSAKVLLQRTLAHAGKTCCPLRHYAGVCVGRQKLHLAGSRCAFRRLEAALTLSPRGTLQAREREGPSRLMW